MNNMRKPLRIKTISEFHELRGLSKPEHPLISVVNLEEVKSYGNTDNQNIILDFYSIAIKRSPNLMFIYGQQEYDFDEGVMFFMAPNQVFRAHIDHGNQPNLSGWMLLIHPDFLWNSKLADGILNFEFFQYAVNEALFLSNKEELIINQLIENIKQEYNSNIDKFSQDIIIAQLEVLLKYCERFYERQFITRKVANHLILTKLEKLLDHYFANEDIVNIGLPTVQGIAQSLNLSPNYLSGLLKSLTGMSCQQHIHEKLIQKAKEKLSTTELTISEIAYSLGFEHPQSFSNLFKSKTNLSPLEFRASFN